MTATVAIRPAAGPETLKCELLISPTTMPPAKPAIRPLIGGTPEPNAIPRHKERPREKRPMRPVNLILTN